MNLPTVLAVEALGDSSPITIGFGIGLLAVGIAWGEARHQISALREWRKEAEEREKAREQRIAALEVREGRTMERLDYLATRLDRIDEKLERLLERSHP